jgi:hypothetical protein
MAIASSKFEHLASRSGFNEALGHFRAVSSLIEDFEARNNLADLLGDLLEEKQIASGQILPIISALLLDKYGYKTTSYTMEESLTDFSHIYERCAEWNAVDLVIVYFHPDLGPLAINPKNKEHFTSLNNMRENELVTIYSGFFADEGDEKLQDQAIKSIIKLLQGKKAKSPESLTKGSYKAPSAAAKKKPAQKRSTGGSTKSGGKSTAKKSAQKSSQSTTSTATQEKKESSSGKRRMTPFYSIVVTNELFHNGNVEAWKKIIQSYKVKHPDLEVYIYYDGERIQDIHSLFKWGKVKHGSSILVAVAGEDIKDVAKLQRYLRQGASPQFESFLKYPVNKILNLF